MMASSLVTASAVVMRKNKVIIRKTQNLNRKDSKWHVQTKTKSMKYSVARRRRGVFKLVQRDCGRYVNPLLELPL